MGFIGVKKVNVDYNAFAVQQLARQNVNAKNNVHFAKLFNKSHNTGELSPRVDSDLGYSPVGNVLPHLYA